jgi:ribosomal protein L29
VKLDERRTIHAMTIADLATELATAERQLLDARFDAGLNRLSNPALLHKTRKRIALMKTLIREKELLAEHGFQTMDEYKAYRHAERLTFKAARKAK